MVKPIQWPRRSWLDVVGWGFRCVVVSLRGGPRGWRRQCIVSHVSMHCVFEECSKWNRWVEFRSVVAQGCRT
eukprot:517130-Pyramimonas_sp.AAC.1